MSINPNDDNHHTMMYKYEIPVYRRGIPLTFTMNMNIEREHIGNLYFYLNLDGPREVEIQIYNHVSIFGWRYEVLDLKKENKYRFTLHSSENVPIGMYHFIVYYQINIIAKKTFLLVFNPWFEKDEVYLNNEKLIGEYLLSPSTVLFVGSKNSIDSKKWMLDQFENDSVRAVVNLLNRMSHHDRKSAVEVSRALSALVNSNDDNGIIVGNWSGKYEDGVHPSHWHRSGDILTEFINNRTPVKYGQCWVFSAVLCTVMRAIGIPSRCITSFDSFHDSDGTLNWEIYYDENLNVIKKGSDSCWNFHCWNEAWMRRQDLGTQYDGWQVLDATPQERSGGIFRLGPASKYAIKHRKINRHFDVGFAFAEVNATKIYYKKDSNGEFKKYMTQEDKVGKNISTKMVGSDKREDITVEYKYQKEDTMNPESVSRPREFRTSRNIKITFKLPSKICITQGLNGKAIVQGMIEKGETIIKREMYLTSYTGKFICGFLDESFKSDKTGIELPFQVSSRKINEFITKEAHAIKCKVTVFDPRVDELITKHFNVNIIKPCIEIVKLKKFVSLHSPINIRICVKNLIGENLTNLSIKVRFTDYNSNDIHIGTIGKDETHFINITLNATSKGRKWISFGQVSDQCSGFVCTESFYVND